MMILQMMFSSSGPSVPSVTHPIIHFPLLMGPGFKPLKATPTTFTGGIDIPRTNGTDLHAVQGGKIFRARTSSSGDLYIALRINHTSTGKSLTGYNYFYAIYRHLNQTLVSENDTVSQGDVIALSG